MQKRRMTHALQFGVGGERDRHGSHPSSVKPMPKPATIRSALKVNPVTRRIGTLRNIVVARNRLRIRNTGNR